MRKNACLLVLLSLFVAAIPAQTNIDYEKILLPVVILHPVPGQHGSLWVTDLWFLNHSGEDVWVDSYFVDCQILCTSDVRTPSGLSFRPIIGRRQGVTMPGQFLFVERALADSVTIHLRVQDISRQLDTWGTRLPVVRERAFRSQPLQLLDIPVGERFRQTLRIYELSGAEPSEVRVRVYAIFPDIHIPQEPNQPKADALLAEQVYLTETVIDHRAVSSYPGYIEIGNLPEMAGGNERLRVEIEPVEPDVRLWSFISITNNETQHVTVIAPE
jgi:hypothetical protein